MASAGTLCQNSLHTHKMWSYMVGHLTLKFWGFYGLNRMAKSVFSLSPSSLLATLCLLCIIVFTVVIKITWYVMCHVLGSLCCTTASWWVGIQQEALFIVQGGDSAATNGVTCVLPPFFLLYALLNNTGSHCIQVLRQLAWKETSGLFFHYSKAFGQVYWHIHNIVFGTRNRRMISGSSRWLHDTVVVKVHTNYIEAKQI